MRRDDLFPFHVILSSRDRHESRRKIRSKGKMEGKVKEIGRQRRGIETVALRTCIEYLKESIYISVLSPISIFSSQRNKESKDLRSILVSPPRYEKEIYLNLWHCAGKNSVSKESISPLRRNLEREEDSKRSMSPAEEISRDVSSLVRLEPVSQSVSQFFDEENGGATWTSLVARKWGVRDWFASVRGSATSRICLLSPLSRDERGSGGSRARFENWRDGYARSGWRQPFAYQLHTRWLQSSCHPSTRSSTCGLPSRAYRASPTIFFSIPRDVSVSFLPLSLAQSSLSSSFFASSPPFSSLLFFVRSVSASFFTLFLCSSRRILALSPYPFQSDSFTKDLPRIFFR